MNQRNFVYSFSLDLHSLLLTKTGMPFIRYGCPSMEEIESYNQEYKRRLDEIGALGEIPHNLAIEVTKSLTMM